MRMCVYDGGGGSDFCHFGAYILIERPLRMLTSSSNSNGSFSRSFCCWLDSMLLNG